MSEKKYAYRICPCHNYDVEGIQTWLEDMAAKGLILSKEAAFAGFLTFERTMPQRVRYRLEAVEKSGGLFGGNDSASEFHEIATQFGWEFVCEYGAFQVFRTDDPSARELNTDPAIQALSLKRLRKERWTNFICMLAQFVILFFLRRWHNFFLFRTLVSVGLIGTASMVLFILWVLFRPITDIFHITKQERRLRNEHGSADHKNNRGNENLRASLRCLPAILCVIGICFWGIALIRAADRQAIADYPDDPPFITMTDLIGNAEYERSDGPLGGFNYYVEWDNAVSPVNVEWREYMTYTNESGSHMGFMIVEYHETVSEWFAKGLADDYYHYQRTRWPDQVDLQAPDSGLDNVRVFGDLASYDVLIQHDNTVIYATVHFYEDTEKEDWLLWLEAMADMLLNGGN